MRSYKLHYDYAYDTDPVIISPVYNLLLQEGAARKEKNNKKTESKRRKS